MSNIILVVFIAADIATVAMACFAKDALQSYYKKIEDKDYNSLKSCEIKATSFVVFFILLAMITVLSFMMCIGMIG